MLFSDLAPPTLQNSRISHDSTRTVLTCTLRGLPPKSQRSVVSIYDLKCVTSITEKTVVLVWPGAAHAPIAVKVGPQVHSVQQCVCTILSTSVEIWQYEGKKPVFE